VTVVQYVWSEKIDSILGAGKSLEMLGVRNWALDQAGALDALERLRDEGIAVSGGDVYRRENDRLEPTYDNWYCDRGDGEQGPDPLRGPSEGEYVERSIGVAMNYITGYLNSDGRAFFSLVPGAQ